jgi:hypothetical protein
VLSLVVPAVRLSVGAGIECGIGPADGRDPSARCRSTAADCGVRRCPSTISEVEDVSVTVCEGGLVGMIVVIVSMGLEEEMSPVGGRFGDFASDEMPDRSRDR